MKKEETDKLEDFQKHLRELKAELNKAKGALEFQFTAIKKDFQVDTMQQLEKKIAKMQSDRVALEEKLKVGVAKLRKDFD